MFSYSGNPMDSLKDEVRFRVGDTDPLFAMLEDEEIEFLLSSNNNHVLNTCINACNAILAKLAKEVDYKIGPESVSASDRYKQYSNTLKMLQNEKMTKNTYIINCDQCDHEPNFAIGFQDNTPWTHK